MTDPLVTEAGSENAAPAPPAPAPPVPGDSRPTGEEPVRPRERTVHPTFDIGGPRFGFLRPSGWLALGIVLFGLGVSFLHSRTFSVEAVGADAVFERGDFWLWGRSPYTPRGREAAFRPVPYTEPPAGAALSGSKRDAADAWYGMVYRVARAAEHEPDVFARYDRQAVDLEAWYKEEFGAQPGMLGAMAQVRQGVRQRREAVEAYRKSRAAAVKSVREALARLPTQDPTPAMEDERLLYEQFLREMAEVVQ